MQFRFIFVTAALLAVSGAQGQQVPGNGWDDYKKAEAIMNDGLLNVYADPIGGASATPWVTDPLRTQIAEMSMQLKTKDYLAQQYAAVRRYSAALESVLAGNQKAMVAQTDTQSLHDVLPVSYHAAKLFAAKAYCQASEGDIPGAIQSLLAGLVVTDRMNGYTVVGNLFGDLADTVTFERFSELLPSLSLRDLSTVRSFVSRQLAGSEQMDRMIRTYQTLTEGHIAAITASSAGANDNLAEISRALAEQLSTAGAQDMQTLAADLRQASQSQFDQMIQAVHRPETEWWEATSGWPQSTAAPEIPDHATMDQVSQALLPTLILGLHRIVVVELTRRTEFRLLGLNAALVEYRWHNHRLPAQLSDFVTDQDGFDPLANQPFVYKPEQDGTYRIYSQGRPDTGVVELKYAGRPSVPKPGSP